MLTISKNLLTSRKNNQGMRMKITVKLFAFFRQDRFTKEEREYPETTLVSEVIGGLGITLQRRHRTMASSRLEGASRALGSMLKTFMSSPANWWQTQQRRRDFISACSLSIASAADGGAASAIALN